MKILDSIVEYLKKVLLGWAVGKMGNGCQMVQTSSYKINQFGGYNVQHGEKS